jgi:GDPmannose 4,6-dehydratase
MRGTPIGGMRVGVITGITGQDGSYLAELLLNKGYKVIGIVRHTSHLQEKKRIEHLLSNPNLTLRVGDITDSSSMQSLVTYLETLNSEALEVYNLAAQSFVKLSFDMPEMTTHHNCIGVTKLLEAFRMSSLRTKVRIYQASSSEMYGKVLEVPQTESTPFYPRSPYGVTKVYAYWMSKNYRESSDMFVSNGILFNHESPRRSELFVTRKVTAAAARIAKGNVTPLVLGNLNAQRDWGHAKDYVEAMWRILQYPVPDDWVISSNETHSVRELVEVAFREVGLSIKWSGSGDEEIGTDQLGRVIVKVSPEFYRPTEVDLLIGDSTKARTQLNWTPQYTFESLIQEMVSNDLAIQS